MFMRQTANRVKPWFEQCGTTLDDVPSFRHMNDVVRREIKEHKGLLAEWRKFPQLADECVDLEHEIADAEKLFNRIEHRIIELTLLRL